MGQLAKIQTLMKFLPEKDYSLGIKLLSERNWSNLRSLVYSAIVKTERLEDTLKPHALEEQLEGLRELRAELDYYISQIYGDQEEP